MLHCLDGGRVSILLGNLPKDKISRFYLPADLQLAANRFNFHTPQEFTFA